ncbi:helix-turn-helix domain-containing protein [Cetobacterium somerae]|uniref:helix-turn-helix domain-containing protein n=1 Tax=Cetobacterium somerae TaxID=188913 RepID=UPI00211EA10E|nr:helix-turn-helix domain-containing protein [Cetobacterium somerae]MCQ9626590.1 helix-turn-helix domain-containing protein [Cetobacterium somerae]
MEKKIFELSDLEAKKLGEFFKERREKLGYSTNYIEIHTGINKADLSRIENGKKKKINPIYLKQLSKILKLDQIEVLNKVGYIDNEYMPGGALFEEKYNFKLQKNDILELEKLQNDITLYFKDKKIDLDSKKKLLEAMTEVFYEIKAEEKK